MINKTIGKTILQFIKFAIIGVLNNVAGLFVYYTFIFIYDSLTMALIGQALGWLLGVFVSFLLNRRYTFTNSNRAWYKVLFRMYLGYGFSLGLSLMLTYIQVQLLGISTFIAPLVNISVSVPINFLIHKYWSFKSK